MIQEDYSRFPDRKTARLNEKNCFIYRCLISGFYYGNCKGECQSFMAVIAGISKL